LTQLTAVAMASPVGTSTPQTALDSCPAHPSQLSTQIPDKVAFLKSYIGGSTRFTLSVAAPFEPWRLTTNAYTPSRSGRCTHDVQLGSKPEHVLPPRTSPTCAPHCVPVECSTSSDPLSHSPTSFTSSAFSLPTC
jgi:hypothetical protein